MLYELWPIKGPLHSPLSFWLYWCHCIPMASNESICGQKRRRTPFYWNHTPPYWTIYLAQPSCWFASDCSTTNGSRREIMCTENVNLQVRHTRHGNTNYLHADDYIFAERIDDGATFGILRQSKEFGFIIYRTQLVIAQYFGHYWILQFDVIDDRFTMPHLSVLIEYHVRECDSFGIHWHFVDNRIFSLRPEQRFSFETTHFERNNPRRKFIPM